MFECYKLLSWKNNKTHDKTTQLAGCIFKNSRFDWIAQAQDVAWEGGLGS